MTDAKEILATFKAIEDQSGGPFLADTKECARATAKVLGTTYEKVRDVLLDENGGLFG